MFNIECDRHLRLNTHYIDVASTVQGFEEWPGGLPAMPAAATDPDTEDGSRRIVGTYASPKHVPEMFYGIHVRGSSRPVHPDNPLLLQKCVDYCSAMARRIVVLEHGAVANRLQRGQYEGP